MIFDKFLNSALKALILVSIVTLSILSFNLWKDTKIKQQTYIAQKTIIGRGSAEIKVVPDVASFNFTIRKTHKNISDAQKEIVDISNKALAALLQNNINKNDIKTLNYSIYPDYERIDMPCQKIGDKTICPPAKVNFKGYIATQNYLVKIRDIEKSAEILSSIAKLDISEIGGLNFIIDNIEQIKSQARIKAIENAKNEASNIANALGLKLKKIIKFQDDDSYYRIPQYAHARALSVSASPESDSSIMAGEETVSANVQITFEFE